MLSQPGSSHARWTTASIIFSLLYTCAYPVHAANTADRIRIEYAAPENPAHQHVYKMMQQRRVLERLQKFLSFIRLPAPLLLKTAGCDGVSNAWYEEAVVTFCYDPPACGNWRE